jgi:hypothetical protein
MTCREKLMKEHPDDVEECWLGGCCGCPDDHDYLDSPEYCNGSGDDALCTKCWDREIPETDEPRILDSGERREFGTGAVRDIQEGKGRCDLMPLDVVNMYMGVWDGTEIFNAIYTFQQTGNPDDLLGALWHFNELDPFTTVLEVAKHFEAGAKKYGEYNWQKGIPVHCYIDSAVRHYLKYLRGDNDEPHDRAFVWNILCCIWTCKHKPELIDLPFVQNNKERED